MNGLAVAGQFLRSHFPHLVAAMSAVMLGLGVGYIKVSTSSPKIDLADNWTLPRWAPYQPSLSARELTALELWGKDEGAQESDEPTPQDVSAWRFIGVVQDGENRLAVIEVGPDRNLHQLSAGDRLPSGAEILNIDVNGLTYQGDGAELTITLFSTETH
jgi:hypothetical protein